MKGGLVGDRDRVPIVLAATCGNAGGCEAYCRIPHIVISILCGSWVIRPRSCGNGSQRLTGGGRVTGGFAGGSHDQRIVARAPVPAATAVRGAGRRRRPRFRA